MQLKNKLNSSDLGDRLNGHSIFLHNFSGFSTTSAGTSVLMHTIHAALTMIFILIVIYAYLVVGSILNIVEKKSALINIDNSNKKIAQIESFYAKKVSGINQENILLLGLIKSEANSFVERKDPAASLSFLFER